MSDLKASLNSMTEQGIPLLCILPSTCCEEHLEANALSVPFEEMPNFTILFSLEIVREQTTYEPILINGIEEKIPKKLLRALLHLRYYKKPRYVFVFDLPMSEAQGTAVINGLDNLVKQAEYLAIWNSNSKEIVEPNKTESARYLNVLQSDTSLKRRLSIQTTTTTAAIAIGPYHGNSNYTLVSCKLERQMDGNDATLEESYIPLLVLEPAEGSSETVECKTVYFRLDRLPRFIYLNCSSAPREYIESSPEIMWDGSRVPIDSLSEAAFRRLRHPHEARYIHTEHTRVTTKELQVIDGLISRNQHSYEAKWMDPESAFDLSFKNTVFQKDMEEEYEIRKVSLTTHLDPMSLFTVTASYQRFKYYRPIDTSADSTEIRVLKRLPVQASGRPAFQFIHISLEDSNRLQYLYIQTNGFEQPGETNWAEITIDGYISSTSRLAARDLYSLQTDPQETECLFVDTICQDGSASELIHHAQLHELIYANAKNWAILLPPDSHDRIATINKIERFQHPLLDQNAKQVRLLRLLGSDGNDEAPVRLELVSRDLDDMGEYYALSYVWGAVANSKNTVPVLINEHNVLVTTNLESALRQLRHSLQDRYYWIDAICIDQSDFDERAQQVRLMGEIYSRAKQVIAWLGEERNNSNLAMSFLNQTGRNFQQEVSIAKLQSVEGSEEDVREIQKGLLDSTISESLIDFFSREWWWRLWILQEAVLAPALVLYCGRHSIRWEIVERALLRIDSFFNLSHVQAREIPERTRVLIPHVSSPASAIALERNRTMKFKSTESKVKSDELLWNLSCLSQRKYSEARDVVFSALGLFREEYPGIPINYKLSIKEVFTNTARAILDQQQSLKLLSFCQFSARRHTKPPHLEKVGARKWPSWPSWVPDWRQGEPHNIGTYSFRFNRGIIGPRKINFDAGGGSTSDHEYSKDGLVLSVKGVQLDTVKAVLPEKTAKRKPAHGKNGELTVTLFYPSLHEWETAIFPSVDDNGSPNIGKSDEDRAFGLLSSLTLMGRGKLVTEEVKAYNQWRCDRRETGELPTAKNAPAMMAAIEESSESALSYRAMMTTETGYFGLVDRSVLPGDVLCVLNGGPLPLVLRRCGDGKYILVSDAYVPGIMNGEVYRTGTEEEEGVAVQHPKAETLNLV